MIRNIFIFLLIGSSFFLIGCQTNMLKEFERITPGMEKHDVLAHMGSPMTSLRLHGRDRWIYIFYADQLRFEKEVHFYDGSVIYVGEKWEPIAAKQAAFIDQQNAKQDEALARQRESDVQERRQNYDGYIRAIELRDRVRYMPEFTPVQ